MRIAINTRFLLPSKLEGFGWFTFETAKRIVEAHPEHEFFFFFDRPYDEKFIFADNVTPIVIRPQARRPILFYLWFEYGVAKALKKHQIDGFISPDGYVSIRSETPQLAVIHDLAFEHHPEDVPGWASRYLKKWFPRFAQRADRIVTVSEYSKQDIVNTYNIAPEKIDVAHNGAAEFFQPTPADQQVQIRLELTDGHPYFVYVGALHPRKNIARLLQAFDGFRQQHPQPFKLVIVGTQMWGDQNMEQTYQQMQHKDGVVFTGHLQSSRMSAIVGSAYALTYVSYFEGFGLPIAEAFKCGTAVIAGNRTSLPEVAGDAALLVDPFDVPAITAAMVQLAGDEALRHTLAEKGSKRAQQFNWDFTAVQLWTSFQTMMKNR